MEKIILLQKSNSGESRLISTYAALNDFIKVLQVTIDDLYAYVDKLKSGAMPVGSVEFMQKCFELLNIKQPAFNCYDKSIENYLFRNINKICVSDLKNINHPVFIKPEKLKQFNGFVFNGYDSNNYDSHDEEQIKQLLLLDGSEIIFSSDVVNFIAEWRCYITSGQIVASCRYDDNDDEYDLILPDGLIDIFSGKTIAVDIGLTGNNNFCVVELNDAWAIGAYKGISPKDYFEFIDRRWSEII